MPRQARKESRTGIYHVMLRGISRQDIFEDREDYVRMLECLHRRRLNPLSPLLSDGLSQKVKEIKNNNNHENR